MNKLSLDFQSRFKDQLIYNPSIFDFIDPKAELHKETKSNPMSSAQSCLNVLGQLATDPENLINFLNDFGLNIDKIMPFPKGADVGGEIYNDEGYVIFEWIGPSESPLYETGGGRGHCRTSIDAYIIAEIEGKLTQLLIEWKFAEGIFRSLETMKFSGLEGLERLRRYSQVLVPLRNTNKFPFIFDRKGGIGLFDFSVDHLFQLMRMTLLAKKTTPIIIGKLKIDDYRIVHLSHSQNEKINILHDEYLTHSPGFRKFRGMKLYDAWRSILTEKERQKFIRGHWDISLPQIANKKLRGYLLDRYYSG